MQKSETMRVRLLKSVDGRSRRREESIVCVSPFFSLHVLLYSPCPSMVPWTASPQSATARSLQSFGVLVPVRPRSIAAGSTDASWRLCLAYVQVYKLLFGESRLPKRGKGLIPESLRGRRAAVSLARVDAGEGGPGPSERGDAHGMRLLASE